MIRKVGFLLLTAGIVGILAGCIGNTESEGPPPAGQRPPAKNVSAEGGGRDNAALAGREGKGGY